MATDFVRTVESFAVENALPHRFLNAAVVQHCVIRGLEVVPAPMMEQVALGIEIGSAEVACRGFAQEWLARPFVARAKKSIARQVSFFLADWHPLPRVLELQLPRSDACMR